MLRAALLLVVLLAAAAGAAADELRSPPDGVAVDDPPLTRASLRMEAFGLRTLPRTLPRIERRIDRARFPYAARVDRLTVPLPLGFSSVAYDLRPHDWNGRTLIWHNGHAEDVDANPNVLRWFLARNWRVVTMAMPLAGENAHPGYDEAGGLHDGLARLPRPLEMFLLPVVAVVNYTHAAVMSGLSGGGWTTVAAAAIDTRIRRSYPVAGTMPLPWLCESGRPRCEGDLEYRMIGDYVRAYELGSDGGRRQVALYSRYDPCCFSGESSELWAPLVRGNFRAVIDQRSHEHAVTRFDLRVITKDLGRDGG